MKTFEFVQKNGEMTISMASWSCQFMIRVWGPFLCNRCSLVRLGNCTQWSAAGKKPNIMNGELPILMTKNIKNL